MEKQLLQAAVLQARADEEPDEIKAKTLVNRVLKIKEDVTRAATARASSMSDQEERAVVLSSLKSLQRGDTERACKILEERLKKLARRIENKPDSDDDESSDAADTIVKPVPQPTQDSQDPASGMVIGDWIKVIYDVLHITEFDDSETTASASQVDSRGRITKIPTVS